MHIPPCKKKILFHNNGLAIWHGFPDITHIEVINGRKLAILNFIELTFFRAYPSLKPHILFYSNGLAIWHSFPNITILMSIMTSSRPFLI